VLLDMGNGMMNLVFQTLYTSRRMESRILVEFEKQYQHQTL
jgi:hypothetical protein